MGRAVFEPVPAGCRLMTPVVDVGFPKVLVLVTTELELVEDEMDGDDVVSRVELAGEIVAEPEAVKVKV